jgi:hypothetical protein
MSNVNPKVTAAGFTAALTGLILYCLNQIAFVAAMDEVTKGFVYVIVLGVVTFAAGYLKSNSGGEHRA